MPYSIFSIRRLPVKSILALVLVIVLLPMTMRSQDTSTEKTMSLNKLTPEEQRVILHKGTEAPFSGKYYDHTAAGTYTCCQCGAALYRSQDKFDSGCGWPSFDDAIPGAVKRIPDADGRRVEITCARCGGHLGHVFEGEQFTPKNVRHCVNSISLGFIPVGQDLKTEKAYFAGGCFWGMEYYLEKAAGVLSARVGYMGGRTSKPTYEQVCAHGTGHAEAIEVVFDPAKTNFETLARLFFEIHDPTQKNRQGPDIGDQYRSAIFYVDDAQKQTAEKLISLLKVNGYPVVTELAKADTFWEAEKDHQDYYDQNGQQPYCHARQKRF